MPCWTRDGYKRVYTYLVYVLVVREGLLVGLHDQVLDALPLLVVIVDYLLDVGVESVLFVDTLVDHLLQVSDLGVELHLLSLDLVEHLLVGSDGSLQCPQLLLHHFHRRPLV